jgi:dTDP-4-amino-4,6-dideoxygalactose transaminase
MVEKQINVTRPYLPPLDEYVRYLEGIWARGQLTNHGPLACELEEQLERQLGVKHLFFVNNGTVALQIALKALNVQGDVLTTPFSYVATTSSIVWEKMPPDLCGYRPGNAVPEPGFDRTGDHV